MSSVAALPWSTRPAMGVPKLSTTCVPSRQSLKLSRASIRLGVECTAAKPTPRAHASGGGGGNGGGEGTHHQGGGGGVGGGNVGGGVGGGGHGGRAGGLLGGGVGGGGGGEGGMPTKLPSHVIVGIKCGSALPRGSKSIVFAVISKYAPPSAFGWTTSNLSAVERSPSRKSASDVWPMRCSRVAPKSILSTIDGM